MSTLYVWRLMPIGSGAPFPDPLKRPLIGQVICSEDAPCTPSLARVWLFGPLDAVTHIPPRVLGEMVAALDEGLSVAVLGDDAGRVRLACSTILQLVGGHHA